MRGTGRDFLSGDFRSIVQNLVAAAIGGGLLPAVTNAWKIFHWGEPPEWAKGTLPNVIGAVILIPAALLVTKGVSRLAERRSRRTARPKGDRLSIYVAQFENDTELEGQESVIATLLKEFGRERVEAGPAGIHLRRTRGVSTDDANNDALVQARKLLQKKNGDLLIWGKLHTVAGKPAIEVRFVSVAHDGQEEPRFELTNTFLLEVGFGAEMGTALAALTAALAAPVVTDSGKYLGHIQPSNRETASAAGSESSRIDEVGRSDPGSLLLRTYTVRDWTIVGTAVGPRGRGRGISGRSQGTDTDRMGWAKTQNQLGVALLALGRRERGSERLEEAVAAFRDALQERTRDRVPLEWATTQTNLGNALGDIGGLERGSERLEEAVAVFRDALQERTRQGSPGMGHDADQPRQRALEVGRAGERHRALGGSGSGISRGTQGSIAGEGSPALGDDAEQPRQYARDVG